MRPRRPPQALQGQPSARQIHPYQPSMTHPGHRHPGSWRPAQPGQRRARSVPDRTVIYGDLRSLTGTPRWRSPAAGLVRPPGSQSLQAGGQSIQGHSQGHSQSGEDFLYRSRRPDGPLAPPTRQATPTLALSLRRARRWSAGAKSRRFGLPGQQTFTAAWSMRCRCWLPLRHCPGRPEPVKGAYSVGFAADP